MPDLVYIAAEAVDGCLTTIQHGLHCFCWLVATCNYIFNMEYPSWSRNFFLFVETVLMDICKELKKRMFIDNFSKEL